MAETHARTQPSASSVELNPEQRAAVEHGDGPLLVVAGAGTGKTRVITERIRYLLETWPELEGENILGLTFTDKAAGEMKTRLVRTVGERARRVWLGTFHSFCFEQILLEAYPNLRVLDETEHWILLRRHLRELGLERFKRLSEPGQYLSDFVKFFSRCQDELVTPDDYQNYIAKLREEYEGRKAKLDPEKRAAEEEELAKKEEVAQAYRVSERLLREKGLITFGGQLQRAVELLDSDAELLARLRQRYRYLLVDEFQDTNIAQLELLWLLASDHRNIAAVGDDDQAIYRFRGASFGSFTLFLERFWGRKAAGKDERPIVSLTRNYRSTHRILQVASHVITMNEKSPLLPSKRLVTEHGEGEKIRIVEFGSPEEEAHWVADELERLYQLGKGWRSLAVLYRKHTHRDRLVDALRRKQIPFVIKKLSILSSTIVRDLIAYLLAVEVPSDNVACARVLGVPYWKFEARDLVRLAERANRSKDESIGDLLKSPQQDLAFAQSARKDELKNFLEGLRQLAKRASAAEVFDELVAQLDLGLLPSDADRLNLERFAGFLREWEKGAEGKSLHDFVEYLEYFEEAGGAIHLEEESKEDAVQLMTVHAAKGLEFDYVFILHLSSGEFPSRPRPTVLEFPPELMKEERPKGDFHIQEERRLFYVAMTRARRLLTLSTVVGRRKKWSVFLDDILSEARIKREYAVQLAPKMSLPPAKPATGSPPANSSRPRLFGPTPATARAYSQIALWAMSYHPPLPEPLQLSASAIESYEKCPMQYMFQYVWRLRGGPNAAMTFGNVMHTTIREFVRELHKRGSAPFPEVASTYEREWSSAGFRDAYQEGEYKKAGREQLEAFHRSYTAAPPDLIYQEKPFELPMDPKVVITGRIDQVNRLSRKKVEIVDYKTGRPKQAKEAKTSLQLSLYALAAREIFELSPWRLVFWNLTTNEQVATARDTKELERAREKVAEVAEEIRAGEFPARPGFICRYCEYRLLCPAHEQLLSIQPASAQETRETQA